MENSNGFKALYVLASMGLVIEGLVIEDAKMGGTKLGGTVR